MDRLVMDNQAARHVDAYIEYNNIVGNADGGKMMSEKEFGKFKEDVKDSRKNRLYCNWRNMDTGDDWLSQGWQFPDEGFDLEDAVLRLIQNAIDQAEGNVSAAGRMLGVPRDYIRYRLAKAKESD